MSKKAVILFNLGGPSSLHAVKPFLFNLFYDKHMIDLPNPIRWLLANYISTKRAPYSRNMYRQIGGKSPILDETKRQQAKLQSILGADYRVFIAMRYWHPFIEEILAKISGEKIEQVILLPLYPQYSIATSLSSIRSCYQLISLPKKVICCYHDHPLLIKAHSELIMKYYARAAVIGSPIVLFSAHGVPISFIEKGDPYQFQIRRSVEKIVQKLSIANLQWEICYQSKVGRKKWLEPSLHALINKHKQCPIVLVPISFVSEHSETLVELDIDCSKLTNQLFRVPTLGTNEHFIQCLADLCRNKIEQKNPCPIECKQCFQRLPN